MKICHSVNSAPTLPQPGKIYGARLGGIKLLAGKVRVEWEIFARRQRRKKHKALVKAKAKKESAA